MSNHGDTGANGAEGIQQADSGANLNVNDGNDAALPALAAPARQALAAPALAAPRGPPQDRPVHRATHQAGVHRRQDGSFTMSMAERGRLGQERW